MSARVPARGHTLKHVKTGKAAKRTVKHRPNHHKLPATHHAAGHKVHAKGTHAHHAKAAGFAVGDLLPVCALEAVARSLRLAGQPVGDDEVEHLWELLGAPAEGVSVGEALAAAALLGLGGAGPGRVHPVQLPLLSAAMVRPGYRQVYGAVQAPQFPVLAPVVDWAAVPALCGEFARMTGYPASGGGALILRIDVPGPHAVLATADGWWSWGELHDPWPCRVEEAWAVSWS